MEKSDRNSAPQDERRTKWLHIRLSSREFQQLQEYFRSTTEQKISAYARHVLLKEPLIKVTRNATADDLLQAFSQLLKDLNGVGNNYNQAIHKLHTLQGDMQYKRWLAVYEADRQKLLHDMAEIRAFIHQAAAVWLQ